jgi:hypothetical protein
VLLLQQRLKVFVFVSTTRGFYMSVNNTQMANAIRALSMDAVQKANSGHPGMPMGMADIAVALWNPANGLFKHNPKDCKWFLKPRVILNMVLRMALKPRQAHSVKASPMASVWR